MTHPDTILQMLDFNDYTLKEQVEGMTAEELVQPKEEGGPPGKQLVRMAWHEAYHVGQTEILRQLYGKGDHAL